jgi:hypothetical protein
MSTSSVAARKSIEFAGSIRDRRLCGSHAKIVTGARYPAVVTMLVW